MLEKNISLDIIVKVTGFTKKEIKGVLDDDDEDVGNKPKNVNKSKDVKKDNSTVALHQFNYTDVTHVMILNTHSQTQLTAYIVR